MNYFKYEFDGVGLFIAEESGAVCRICAEEPLGIKKQTPTTDRAAAELKEYFAGERKSFDFTTVLVGGGDFFRRVAAAMRTVPYGETRTYAQIAEAIGSPKAYRAVGAACGKNPLLIVIPCHRIVASGGIGGFSCGIELKRKLLALENNRRAT